jgi:hypothetical protein
LIESRERCMLAKTRLYKKTTDRAHKNAISCPYNCNAVQDRRIAHV